MIVQLLLTSDESNVYIWYAVFQIVMLLYLHIGIVYFTLMCLREPQVKLQHPQLSESLYSFLFIIINNS